MRALSKFAPPPLPLDVFRRCIVRKPINRELEDELPIFQYPKSKGGDRRLYAWGQALTGALGLYMPKVNENYHKRVKIQFSAYPTRVSFAERHRVLEAACGYGFSAFSVAGEGKVRVYGAGLNTDAQIGYHDPYRGRPLELLLVPVPVSLPLREDTRVTGLAAGRAHLLVLTDKEGVFALGNNSYGQCGRKIIADEDYFKSAYVHNVRGVRGEKIRAIRCGQDHSMFVSESGKVFACGWGSDGQLGNGVLSPSSKIDSVKGDIEGENIVKLACTVDCVLALSDKGEVFGWGNSEYGQLNSGTETIQQVGTSRHLKRLRDAGKIVDVASAGSYCMALNSEGEVFAWGFGILGAGPETQQSRTPVRLPRTLFQNDFLAPAKIVKIATGVSHSAAVSDRGELFMWGRNKRGCLGLGHEEDQFFPLRVAVGCRVLEVACGVDHTLAYCAPFV